MNLILEKNKIRMGEDEGDKLDDPIWRVIDDTEDTNDTDEEDEKDSDLARTTSVFTLEPRAQVFVDEFYSVLTEIMDDDFEEEFPEEYMRLVLLGKLISDLKDPSPGWMSMKGFRAGGHGHAGKVDLEELGVALPVDGGAGGGDVRRSGHIRGGERHGL